MKKLMIVMLVVVFVFGMASTAFAGSFSDVPANSWTYGALNKLTMAGIISGYSDGAFRGDKLMTRYEMAMVVAKALEHAEKADAENKALIDKLSTEFSKELNTLGVRVATVEKKVENLERIKISGSEQILVRSVHDTIKPKVPFAGKSTYGDNMFLLNFDMKVQDNITAFARFGEREFFGGSYGEALQSTYRSSASLDHFGVKVKAGNWDMSLGRQAVKLGQGIIINTGYMFGYNPYFTGLVAGTKINNVEVQVIAGHTGTNDCTDMGATNMYKEPSSYHGSQWYGIAGYAQLNRNLGVGAAFAHEKRDVNTFSSAASSIPNNSASVHTPGLDTTAVSAVYNFSGPLTLIAQAVRSSAHTLNDAWSLMAIYHKNKDKLIFSHNYTEKNSINQFTNIQQGGYQYVLGGSMALVPKWKGNQYIWTHDITPTLQFLVMRLKTYANCEGYSGSQNEGIAGLIFKF